MTDDEWRDYLAHKEWLVQQAENGDVLQAKAALKDAAVALRAVLLGTQPRADLMPAVRFLLSAIERVQDGVPPDKALGLWGDSRPKEDLFTRDALLFFSMGLYYDAMQIKDVRLARDAIARKYKVRSSLVRAAWETHGGVQGWMELKV